MGRIMEPKVRFTQAPKVHELPPNFRFVDTTDIKTAFAARLAEVCQRMGLPDEHGRQSALAKVFGVTPNAARKWLLGIGMPELDLAIRLADWGGVNVQWLLQGVGPKLVDSGDTTPGELFDAVTDLPPDDGQQVFDFIRYKIERADGWFAAERAARYLVLLDKIAATPKPPKAKG